MNRILLALCGLMASALPALADTLELADGGLLEGNFVGSSNGIIMFETGGDVEAYTEDQVVGLYFSEGVEAAEADLNQPAEITVPSGTRLVIRMTDTIDTARHSAGHRFRAQLESALVIEGTTVAKRGTVIYGTINQASSSGRLAGQSELGITFTDILLDDQMFGIATAGLSAQSAPEAGRTIGRTARAAAIGGLMNGSSGARTGAKVGVGASILTSGSSLMVPAGTILETNMSVSVSLPITD